VYKAPRNIDTSKYVPAQEVVSELRRSALPPEGKTFLTAVSVETLQPGPNDGPLEWPNSWSVFRCLFGFKEWTGPLAAFPDWGGDPAHGTHAYGPWQDEPGTYAGAVAMTGRPSVEPQDLIGNNWVIAVTAAAANGIDLLATLRAGQLDLVSPALSSTWPEGCDGNFPARYNTALPLFTNPAPPPPPPTSNPPITLRIGQEETFPVAGVDQDGQPYSLPADALVSDDTSVCTVTITNGMATVVAVGIGQTQVHGASFLVSVTVPAAQHLARIIADWRKAVIMDIPNGMMAAAVLAIGLLLALVPPGDDKNPTFRSVEAVAPLPPEAAKNIPENIPITPSSPQGVFVGSTFCFGPGFTVIRDLEQCRKWKPAP
jgi:hypothetical protein